MEGTVKVICAEQVQLSLATGWSSVGHREPPCETKLTFSHAFPARKGMLSAPPPPSFKAFVALSVFLYIFCSWTKYFQRLLRDEYKAGILGVDSMDLRGFGLTMCKMSVLSSFLVLVRDPQRVCDSHISSCNHWSESWETVAGPVILKPSHCIEQWSGRLGFGQSKTAGECSDVQVKGPCQYWEGWSAEHGMSCPCQELSMVLP